MDLANTMTTIVPLLVSGAMLIIGGLIVVGVAYWLLVVQRRKKWIIHMWEKKADGSIHWIYDDLLIRRKYNRGKQTAYILKYAKSDVVPPPAECVYRKNRKEYADYLRIFNDYVPLKRTIDVPDKQEVKGLLAWMKKNLNSGNKNFLEKEREFETKYTYAPMTNPKLVGQLKFEPMDYDLSVQMTNSMETLDKIYKDQMGFWDKYGGIIAIGACIMLAIITLYMSYGYGETVIKTMTGAADKVAGPLNALVQSLGGVTSSKPPI